MVLTTLVWLLQMRFDVRWASHSHLLYALPSFAAVTAMAWLAPMEGPTPRPYQSVLYVASFALGVYALGDVADALGARAPLGPAGVATWVFAALAALMLAFAVARNSAVSALIGALSAVTSSLAFVTWAFEPRTQEPARWVLLGAVAILALAAVAQRDRRPRHAVALADAAGVAALVIASTFVLGTILGSADGGAAGWGWELVLLGVGFGLCAYAAIDRAPGPAYLGVANLIGFVLIAGRGHGDPSLLGWPLVLALAAGLLLAVGMRPTVPAPPPPDADEPGAETTPLRPR